MVTLRLWSVKLSSSGDFEFLELIKTCKTLSQCSLPLFSVQKLLVTLFSMLKIMLVSDSQLTAQLVPATTLHTAKMPTRVPILDRLLDGGLLPGLLTIIHSNHGAHSLKNLIGRLLEEYAHEGAVVIDGTNQFPAIRLARWARQQRKKPQEVLSKFKVLRPFNYHQCTEAATKYLETEVQNHPSRLLLVLGCPDIYLSDEAAKNLSYDQREATFALLELHQALRTIQSLTMKYGLCTIITAGSIYRHPLGGPYLRTSAGVVIRCHQGASHWEYTLDQHPFLPPRSISQPLISKKTTRSSLLQWLAPFQGTSQPREISQKKRLQSVGSANLTKWIASLS